LPDLRKRFEEFWRERLASLRDAPAGSLLELAVFGSWLAADAADPGATGLLLHDSARLRGGLPVSYGLLRELVAFVPKYPEMALDLLEQFLDGEGDSDKFSWYEREIHSILVAARDAGGGEIKPQLTCVISRLGARGSPVFVSVLKAGASAERGKESGHPSTQPSDNEVQ
jgi:hypothetical protein